MIGRILFPAAFIDSRLICVSVIKSPSPSKFVYQGRVGKPFHNSFRIEH
jgi:hypothetical protein